MADNRYGSLNGTANPQKPHLPPRPPAAAVAKHDAKRNPTHLETDAEAEPIEQTDEEQLASSLSAIDKASTVDEIHACLANLMVQESRISSRLSDLLGLQDELSRELSRLDLIRARLGTQVVAARGLSSGMLAGASGTASRISSAVRALDIEQANVRATLHMVESVVELKQCVLGVSGSMGAAQDWETAAQYIHRASKVPDEIVRSEFAEEMVPTSEEPDPPAVTLSNASESLCGLFLREFDKATKASDGEKITKYFRLFPLIGRSDTGLEVYGGYVCRGVAERMRAVRGRRNDGGLYYAGSLKLLFEYVADVVQRHTPLVEKHYGVGRMVKVIDRLQIEVDTQGGIVIDSFWEERTIGRKLSDIKSYAFSFLVQSFMANPTSAAGVSRTSSPRPGAPGGPRNSEDEGVDVKEIDSHLTELSVMISRWSFYCRFIAWKCQPPPDQINGDTKTPLIIPPVITKSALANRIEEKIATPFDIMSTFFFRRSVEKAFQLDELPTDLHLNVNKPILNTTTPYITLSVDDVMYLVRNVIKRTLSTCSLPITQKTIASVRRILESDFIGMMKRRMQYDSYPRSANANAMPPDNKVISFAVLTNNLDIASEYIVRIVGTFTDAPAEHEQEQQQNEEAEDLESLFPFEGEAEAIRASLNNLVSTFTTAAGSLHNDAIEVLFAQVIRPRLRLLMSESFREIDYLITEADVAAASSGDHDDADGENPANAVTTRFATLFHHMTFPLKRILTPKSYDKLLSTTAAAIASLLAKRLWTLQGRINELGAIRLERDVRGIIGIVIREGKYGLRELFAKSSEIVMILNMEEDEVLEILRKDSDADQADGVDDFDAVEWKLTREERRRARGLLKHG